VFKRTFSLNLVFLFAMLVPASAQNRFVPTEYQTIREALTQCSDGDVIILEPAVYIGPDNCNIDFMGLAITIKSTDPRNPHIVKNTIIDCQNAGRAFVFQSGEDANSVLAGLTIINGRSVYGGAVNFSNASKPKVIDCVFSANSASYGGAVACGGGSRPLLTNCIIKGNSAVLGGAVYSNAAGPTISNSLIAANAALLGGALNYSLGSAAVRNCTFTANNASAGGAIYCYNSGSVSVEGTILWQNTAAAGPQIFLTGSAHAEVSYSDIQGGTSSAVVKDGCTLNWNAGSIADDPCFVQSDGDYHLLENSPCIDTGSPLLIPVPAETDIDGDPRIINKRIDIGADEFSDFPIPAYLAVYPPSLNLASNAQWIKCHIWLPEGYNVADVNSGSVFLAVKENKIRPQKIDIDEAKQLVVVRFACSDLQHILFAGSIELTVGGRLLDGTKFKAADTIRVIDNRSGKPYK